MLDLLPDALADALGTVVAERDREWSREFARAVAEKDALLADLKRENAELLAAVKAGADAMLARVELALSALKDGEPGPKGDRGYPGLTGDPGAQGVPGERGIGIASIERDGARLLFVLDDERCFDVGDVVGPRGEKGEPGIGAAGAFIDRDGKLVMTLSDGATRELGAVVGADGAPGMNGKDGAPGRDGVGFDDLSVSYDGERSFGLQFQRGNEAREFSFKMPVMIYRGIWREGHHERGDVVTRDGSAFVALKDTDEKPAAPPVGAEESAESAWRLMAKSGRNGKNGFNGDRGERGPEGRAGRDLTQVGSDGTKW